MNKINFFFLICLIGLTFSCGDDTVEAPILEPIDQLAGVWNLVELSSDENTVTTLDGELVTATMSQTIGKDFETTIEFSKEPMEYVTKGSFTSVRTRQIDGVVSTLERVEDDYLGSGAWNFLEGKLALTSDDINNGIVTEFDIVELTENRFEYNLTINTSEEDDMGFLIVRDVKLKAVHTR